LTHRNKRGKENPQLKTNPWWSTALDDGTVLISLAREKEKKTYNRRRHQRKKSKKENSFGKMGWAGGTEENSLPPGKEKRWKGQTRAARGSNRRAKPFARKSTVLFHS